MVRSTALAERLDPEDWREVMNRAFAILTGPIERYEGTVARLMGDAFLAFFGAPAAHEDDPQRAIFAALEILNEVKPFAEQIKGQYGLDFAVRVGINTGPVVVGDVGSQHVAEYTAMGDAVNLAARMEQIAQPGTIQIAEDTQRLVAPIFELEDLGGIDVKGKSAPVRAYRVLAAKAHPGQLRGITGVSAPLIGRDREMAHIRDLMEHLQQGRGQVVCLIGEAGLGKSRLLEEARKIWLLQNPAYSWEYVQSSPYDSARPYGLFQKYSTSYGAASRFDRLAVSGHWEMSSFTQTATTIDAIDLALATLDKLHDAGVDAPALASGKSYVQGQFPLAFETSSQWVYQLGNLELYGLDRSYIDGYSAALNAVTPEAARRVITDVIPASSDLVLVVIGNAAEIRDGLRKFGSITEMKLSEPVFRK